MTCQVDETMSAFLNESEPAEIINQRAAPRLRTFKGGRIWIKGSSTIDCKIRDLSVSGAKLAVASVVGIPNVFDLEFTQEKTYRTCEIVWRKVDMLGVRFLSEPRETLVR